MQLLPGPRTLLLLVACGLAAFVAPARGRQDKPQPAPEQDGDVVRVRTDLVQTGVMVFDRQGRFVEGLRREQFELSAGGRPQHISFFEQVRAGSHREEALFAAARGGDAPAAPRPSAAPADRGRTVVFFIDDLHLSLDSLNRTRQMLSRFVEHDMGRNDLVAVASTSGQIGFLQQFTDNKAVLRAAVARLTHKP